MTPDGKVGIGFFGYGFITRAHLSGLRHVQGARVLGICGPHADRARAVAAEFSVDFVTSNPEELLGLPGLDGVVVGSPDHTHHELTMAAIRAGKHVFVEKPIATNARHGREMYEAARKAKLRSMVGFTLRANPLIQRVRRMVEEGEMGEIMNAHAERYGGGVLARTPKINWKTDPSKTGTGVIGDLGSHAIDLLHFWVGPITSVAAILDTHIKEGIDPATGKKAPLTLDDEANLLVRFASGASGTVVSNRVGLVDCHKPLGRSSFTLNGSKAGFLTDGILEARLFRLGHDPEVIDPGLPLEEADHAGIIGFFGETMMRNFVTAIREERDVPPTLADGLRAQEVIDAAVRAGRERRWVDVPRVE